MQVAISEETLATFTNYAASPGQLKVCKIAGMNTPVGTEFTFTVTGLPSFQLEAGPADQGGFCELVRHIPGQYAGNDCGNAQSALHANEYHG